MTKHRVIAGTFAAIVLIVVGGIIYLLWRNHYVQPGIVGQWVRIDSTLCSAMYPLRVEFTAERTYWPEGFSALWTGGTYHFEQNRVRMNTALGAADYRIALRADRVTFTNSLGCTVTYERE